MNTKEKLTNALKEAMRAKDDLRKRTLRGVLAAIKNMEIEKRAALEESAVLAVLQKEVKSRHETIEGAQQAGRPDLVEEAQAEIAVLQIYLPQALSSDELRALAQAVIEELGVSNPAQMGLVMKSLMPRLKGRADGKQASAMVRALLSG